MKLTYEKHMDIELKTATNKLYKRTAALYDELTIVENKHLPLVTLRLSEMFTLKNTLYTLMFTHQQFYDNQEFIELLKTWNQVYKQMKSVVMNNDLNTSWMAGSFHTYSQQNEKVLAILEEHFQTLA